MVVTTPVTVIGSPQEGSIPYPTGMVTSASIPAAMQAAAATGSTTMR